ncbi:MAG TPA: ABC transporter ATP-binding protein [Alphaproteobacteria bacterium]|nr:ABC transporter ATP-binding protein [Alphaproteobacteria bacterium]
MTPPNDAMTEAKPAKPEDASVSARGDNVPPQKKLGDVILKADNISLSFGGVRAISDVSFEIREHEILAIIGPNGAGKTSMLNCINGFYHPQEGTITYQGVTRSQMRPYEAANSGIARTFQNVALFAGMSVLDNIMTGRLLKMPGVLRQAVNRVADGDGAIGGLMSAHRSSRAFRIASLPVSWIPGAAISAADFMLEAVYKGPAQRDEIENRIFVEKIIEFMNIQAIRRVPAGRLPYGLQKRVELARALAAEPTLLLLDEPMAGMNVEEKEDMCRFILDVNDEFGTTIALIEHDMGVVMDISDRVVVLDYGRKLADGSPEEVRGNQDVIDAYLGVPHEEGDD